MDTELTEQNDKGRCHIASAQTCGNCVFKPKVDILESEDELVLKVDVPGAKPEDVALDYNKGLLTVHAKVQPRQDGGINYLLTEYGVGDFSRAFEVSEDVAADKITAGCVNGVLTVHLPKAQSSKPRKIEVKNS
jgi:HSP20 family protein